MLEITAFLAAALLSLPSFSLLVLTTAAVWPKKTLLEHSPLPQGSSPRVAVIVPAHNESANVIPTIDCIRSQLGLTDRLLVVADNCADDTAALARNAGAEVIERHNKQFRGKGYALAFGVDHLRQEPPDVIVVVDADCVVSPGAISLISNRCLLTRGPVQMLNLMHADHGASTRLRVIEFAMIVKNLVRPLGAERLGGACHLMGTGMALPWALASKAGFATGHIAEDMKLGIDLAVAGYSTHFLPECQVSSTFHADSNVTRGQKSRWEHGHLDVMKEELPRLLKQALKTRKPALIALAMDMMIPPLAFYCALLASSTVMAGLLASLWPAWKSAAWLAVSACWAVVIAIGLAWYQFGRQLLSAKELLRTPLYVLWKLPIYLAYFLKKKSGWVRTKRDSET